ncbi:MAG TPA: serine hydrolase domain-containing protein [Thermoanaerobaculia bacterium]|jgi:CubicO group peptidase (beta-lactamase class C family)|nr:serine hydrolase domain-containing protein [Thermoanaerobaculia bacterium]
MKRFAALMALFAMPCLAEEDLASRVDAIFANQATSSSPGCAVGIARGGKTIVERGYGMANLEYDVPITPSTIFEAGSVTKQFTSAAMLLLVQDGKLSLDDRVRKYVPELPESASEITIRQILTHTSGLRDWGTIVRLAGWRRGTRLITHAHVLDVLSRQRELNFPPGTQWSYSNSGYNLAAIVIERVSGKSFPDFTRERIFGPLGMTHSSWRDDYTRIVKGRATAYDPDGKTYSADMDIENIYGNCCLLTTVGDLLRWNENFRTATVGGKAMLEMMQTPAALANGKKIDYGFGLFTGDGEVYHGGATAGWRAFLTRKTNDDLSIALLCNRGDAPTGSIVEKIAALFVPQRPLPAGEGGRRPGEGLVGLYRDPKTDAIVRIIEKDNVLRGALRPGGSGPALTLIEPNRYRVARTEFRFDTDGLHLINVHKPEALYVKVPDANPTQAQLGEYTGSYGSDEVGTTWAVSVDAGTLSAKISPVRSYKLDPTYADGFVSDEGDLLRFTRDANGHINGLDVKADYSPTEGSARVERMHFVRK